MPEETKKDIPDNEVTLSEVMGFLKENVATKEDLTHELRKMQEEILDGVDDKLLKMKGDLIVLMRGEDRKVVGLITILKDKAVLTEGEAKQLLTMEPFPQLIV